MTDQINLNERLEVAKSVILEAGTIAREYFGRISTLSIKNKGLHDLVSEADVNTERFIKEAFANRFPNDAFLGEESGHTTVSAAQGVWVVDPIDGTQPFLNGIPSWCISIAFVHQGSIALGLIYDPCQNELFAGGKDIPATVNGRPIKVHAGSNLSAGLVSIGFSPRTSRDFLFVSLQKLLDQQGMFFRNGSGALSLAYVAADA